MSLLVPCEADLIGQGAWVGNSRWGGREVSPPCSYGYLHAVAFPLGRPGLTPCRMAQRTVVKTQSNGPITSHVATTVLGKGHP